MRVFVTGTGRCGTTTFAAACSHITNYTSGHETHCKRVADLDWPDNHIEVDGHFTWYLPLLVERYPDAHYVWLRRNRPDTVRSIQRRSRSVEKMARVMWMTGAKTAAQARQVAGFHYDNVTALCKAALPPMAQEVWLENARAWWRRFWDRIGAEGNYDAALAEWSVKHNAGAAP